MQLVAAVQDRSLRACAERLRQLGTRGPSELAQGLNVAGGAVRAMTIAAETRQTGLPGRTLERAQRAVPATPSRLAYEIRATGGDVRLKFFGARETEAGVLARPLGDAKVYAHTFIKGGRFPERVTITRLNGQVFRRVDGSSRRIAVVRSGVAIPQEMVRGETAAAFERGVETVVVRTMVTRLGALLP